MKQLFVDTAGWMAMADQNDKHHHQSRESRDEWLSQGGILITSNYVLDETLTLIRMRLGLESAKKWWKVISRSPRCRVEWVGPGEAQRALDWFFKWSDHSFSFTDCTSFILMKNLDITHVLTLDKHFSTAGFNCLP